MFCITMDQIKFINIKANADFKDTLSDDDGVSLLFLYWEIQTLKKYLTRSDEITASTSIKPPDLSWK